MQYAGWKKTTYKDGSFKLHDGQKFILVHKSGSKYWIDYGMKHGSVLATMRPAKDMREAWKEVERAKREFKLQKVS